MHPLSADFEHRCEARHESGFASGGKASKGSCLSHGVSSRLVISPISFIANVDVYATSWHIGKTNDIDPGHQGL